MSKHYRRGDIRALDGVSFQLHQGRFAALIGASGCGKSTLLQLVAGLLRPSAGAIQIMGSTVRGPRADVGMMFQQPNLLPWRSTIDNVLLPIELDGGRRAAQQTRDRAQDLLELVGLDGFDAALPGELSGGMAQRAAICRMLVTQPQLLLLDEPFGALDELTRERMNEELQRIVLDQKATAIMVTHSIAEAVFLADVIYVMCPRPGRVVAEIQVDVARPRRLELLNTPAFGEIVRRVRHALDTGGDE